MKKGLLLMALIITMALVLTGCNGASSKKSSASAKPVEIEFLFQEELSEDELTVFTMAEEALGIKVKYNVVPNDQMRNLIATRMAGGDLPDLFQIEDVQPYKDGYQGNLFANISKLAEENNLESIKKEIVKVEKNYGKIFEEKEGYFRLPTLQTKAFGWHYVYRKDWADAAGVTYDGSLNSFIELCRAMVQQGGEGTTGWTAGGTWFTGTSSAAAFTGKSAVTWNVPNLTTNASGKWYAVEATDGYREGLKFQNMMYEEGLLDPEIFSSNKEQAIQKFVTGKAGILGSNTGWEDQVFNAFTQANPNGVMDALETAPKGPAGYARGSSPGYYKSWIIGTRSTEQSLAAIKFLDLMKSDEYLAIMTKDEGFQNMGGGKGAHGLAPVMGAYGDYSQLHWTAQKGLSHAEEEASVQDPRYVEYATDLSAQYKPEVASVINDYIPKFIIGQLDINDNATWKAYLADMDKAGLPKLLEDIAAQY
jgi:putative aldouronate transport system substrate-binding protein